MKLKRWAYRTLHPLRLLGVVSPSGRYKLPPRWAMSKQGRERWHADDRRAQELAYAADVVGGLTRKAIKNQLMIRPEPSSWAADVAAGPIRPGALTRFTTGGRAGHEHGMTSAGVCGPGGNASASCFDRHPYEPQKGDDAC